MKRDNKNNMNNTKKMKMMKKMMMMKKKTHFENKKNSRTEEKQGNRLTPRPCKGDKFEKNNWRLREKTLVFVGHVQKWLQQGHPFRLAGVRLKIKKMCFACAVS